VYDPLYNQYFSEGEHSAVGAIAGGQVGYRWQTSSWVFGVEAQGNWAHLRGWNTSTDNFSQDNYTRIDSLGLFTGQLGYAWDSALIYVKGGAAVVKDRYTIFDNTVTPIVPLATSSQTRWGATIGVGLEYGFTPNWTAGIEYNHAFLGDKTVNLYDSAGFLYQTDRIHQDLDMVTLRLNYKFVYGAVVAKY
jgi:outer membrane immunogenic protein